MTSLGARVLIADPELEVARAMLSVLESQGVATRIARTGEEAVAEVRDAGIDVVIVDPSLPGLRGLHLIRALHDSGREPLVVVTSGYATVTDAVETMRAGAFDYLSKPVRSEELILVVKRAFERIGERSSPIDEVEDGYAGIVGCAPPMRQVFETIRKVAPSQSTVLIEGESGTGKELVARAIHRESRRRAFPFVAVHCSAVPPELLESELFGHEKGAFTGAVRTQKGKFELAGQGTLLLDEVGTLDQRAQVDLLRVLQEREFTRIGGADVLRAEARVVATTNEALVDLVASGRLREDLYYRLNVVRIVLPPLRERPQDIPRLAQHCLEKYAKRDGRSLVGFTEEALEVLQRARWPGNVRELENAIERAIVMGTGSRLGVADLPEELRNPAKPQARKEEEAATSGAEGLAEVSTWSLPRRIAALERELIEGALEHCGQNRAQAARKLEITERTLRYKIQKHGLHGARSGVADGSDK